MVNTVSFMLLATAAADDWFSSLQMKAVVQRRIIDETPVHCSTLHNENVAARKVAVQVGLVIKGCHNLRGMCAVKRAQKNLDAKKLALDAAIVSKHTNHFCPRTCCLVQAKKMAKKLARKEAGSGQKNGKKNKKNGVSTGRCEFEDTNPTPHFWDPACALPNEDGTVGGYGCNADLKNLECSFCREDTHSGSAWLPMCPWSVSTGRCEFEDTNPTPHFWNPACALPNEDGTVGGYGCNADLKNLECSFCREDTHSGSSWLPKCPS